MPFPRRAPMFVIGTGSTLISVTLPEQLEAGHVDFARQLAAKAWAYAVAVERRYRGLPPLPDTPVPYTLTARGRGPAGCRAGAGGPGAAARRSGGDGMTATSASVRFGPDGVTGVESFLRLTGRTFIRCCIYDDIAPILAVETRTWTLDHRPRTGPGDRGRRDLGRLLAEAVGQYVAELERRVSPAARTRQLPGMAPGRRRDGRADVRRGGWSWYLRPPLGSLPWHARKR